MANIKSLYIEIDTCNYFETLLIVRLCRMTEIKATNVSLCVYSNNLKEKQ